MTASDLLHQLGAAEGHAEDMTVEGEVNLILPFRHRPVCSDSKMSYRAFQNPHLFGCGARHQRPYADRGGSFVHRWRSHAWVCLRRRGKGGREGGREERRVLMKAGEEKEGRGVSGTECHHCVWWGEGARKKENQVRVLVLPGSYREDGVIRCPLYPGATSTLRDVVTPTDIPSAEKTSHPHIKTMKEKEEV
ncbi:unnamed protein product [Pleuronectes platessa]|uniref:Uncharacterized protein n=1 Tax=Pleuronectes platessa TaxID=8262 RepID=A0A9N7TJ29_PLEPL|nr:unnamed protein product [Pleuronectes platessa]